MKAYTLVYLSLPSDEYELELTYNYDREVPYDLDAKYKELKDTGDNVTNLSGLTERT